MERIDIRILCAVFISLFLKVALSQQVWPDDINYEDLRSLGASCEPADSCVNVTYGLDGSADVDTNFYSYLNCNCGTACIKYDTCCVDSPYRRYNTRFYRGSQVQRCVSVYNTHGLKTDNFFMVTECHPRWRGHPQIQNRCHNSEMRDPYSLVPASDSKNDVTYKNFFCAICNFAEPENFKMWTIIMKAILIRNYSDEELVQNMIFSEEKDSWGHWQKFGDEWNFSPITMSIIVPPESNSKPCFLDLIQECDPAWTDRTISQKCLSYMAPIYAVPKNGTFSKKYRNIHCAICNYATFDTNYGCVLPIGTGAGGASGGESFGGFPPPISFTLLFDVNPRDGVQVGKISKCNAGESYDPFFKKCRSLVCGIPGYVLKGNRCLRY